MGQGKGVEDLRDLAEHQQWLLFGRGRGVFGCHDANLPAVTRLLTADDELGYLLRALRNTLISQRRTERRRPATTELLEDADLGTRPSDDPAEATETRQVFAAIDELPEEFRDALVAVDVAGLSYPEAARALGVPEGTLTSRLFRARDRVARRLSEGE